MRFVVVGFLEVCFLARVFLRPLPPRRPSMFFIARSTFSISKVNGGLFLALVLFLTLCARLTSSSVSGKAIFAQSSSDIEG